MKNKFLKFINQKMEFYKLGPLKPCFYINPVSVHKKGGFFFSSFICNMSQFHKICLILQKYKVWFKEVQTVSLKTCGLLTTPGKNISMGQGGIQ